MLAPLNFLIKLFVVILTLQYVATAKVKPRIVGGKTTNISQQKYLVQVRRGSELCGGSLIRPKWVLTAAHCVKGYTASQFYVLGGTSYLSGSNGVGRSVSRIAVAPKYNKRTMNMDAALLKLNDSMTGTNIAPISLGGFVKPGTTIRVSGWGVTSATSSSASYQVRSIQVPVWRTARCNRAYRNSITITSLMFCASKPGKKDACSGDSGGGAVQNNKLVGIVSFGAGCASPVYAGVYTRVSRVKKWVRNTIKLYS